MPWFIDRLLELLPAFLHRMLLRRAFVVRRWWFRLFKPHVSGVRIIGLDNNDRVLLVRHTYGPSAWMAPGGHMRRDEDGIPAARREAAEELGIDLVAPRLVSRHQEHVRGAHISVHVVAARIAGTPHADTREIAASGWFAADALPPDASPPLAGQLPRWIVAYHAAIADGGDDTPR